MRALTRRAASTQEPSCSPTAPPEEMDQATNILEASFNNMHHDDLSEAELAGKVEQDEDPQVAVGAEKKPFVPPTISEATNIFQATRFFQFDSLGGPGEV